MSKAVSSSSSSPPAPMKRDSIDPGSDEDLDPRIQVELEKLNNSTDEINKLEKELDEANGQFRNLLSQQGGELEKLIRKLGPSIDRARPFYDAKGAADELHKKCLEAAAQFHRATDIHRAARETVTAVENRYEKDDVNFDSAWQEVLNHATIQVMDAEKQKSDSERCHRALAEQFYAAEKKVYELRKLLERDILKSKPYFDMKNRLNGALSEVKTRTVKLQSGITAAKRAYSLALSNLEMISEEIHRKRTPGVGAENEVQQEEHHQSEKRQLSKEEESSNNEECNSKCNSETDKGQRGIRQGEGEVENGDRGDEDDDDDEEDSRGDRRGDGASSSCSSSGQTSGTGLD